MTKIKKQSRLRTLFNLYTDKDFWKLYFKSWGFVSITMFAFWVLFIGKYYFIINGIFVTTLLINTVEFVLRSDKFVIGGNNDNNNKSSI